MPKKQEATEQREPVAEGQGESVFGKEKEYREEQGEKGGLHEAQGPGETEETEEVRGSYGFRR